MKKSVIFTGIISLLLSGSCREKSPAPYGEGQEIIISKERLRDKIKGGWAAQTIGVTYGGPTEFRFCGTMIQEYTPIDWYDGYLAETYERIPGLYDDVYMDLTFVDVFERCGLDAPADSFARAFAYAGYPLWHANRAARYNIRHGIMPPESGHWLNNPHAEDIDFQIEADFAGLMSPGMVNSAVKICDRVGHIMNYGDGWYGGVYVAAMYSLAFVYDDIERIVKDALKTIPGESEFYRCIRDVIGWYEEYPDDWKRTWFEVEKKWSSDIGCPEGVFRAFNIDAKINAAYVVIGLLYGNGDLGKTLDISTRCGQDSDCNPATAGGILATVSGYEAIPRYWKMGLAEVEPVQFEYTDISLEKVYDMSYRHALEMIKIYGGSVREDQVVIPYQIPESVPLEVNFEGHFPTDRIRIPREERQLRGKQAYEFSMDGIGFVLTGRSVAPESAGEYHVNYAEVSIDGESPDTIPLPVSWTRARTDICWKYGMDEGRHQIRIRLLDPDEGCGLDLNDILVYGIRD